MLGAAVILAILGLAAARGNTRGSRPRFLVRRALGSGGTVTLVQLAAGQPAPGSHVSVRLRRMFTSYSPDAAADTAARGASRSLQVRVGRLILNVQSPWRG
jgi:hypothetical protein